MRTVTNSPSISHEFKLSHPFTMLASGGSGMGKVSFSFLNYNLSFQTSFIERAIAENKLSFRPRKIICCYPGELDKPPNKVRK